MKQKTNRILQKMSAIIFVLSLFAQTQLFGWSDAIKIAEQDGITFFKPVVCYSPEGKIFVAYQAGTQIHLSSFDGTQVAFLKRISESSLMAYEASMYITKRGYIHLVWIEAASYEANTQYVKYRYYNGSSWSDIAVLKTLDIPGTLPGGFITRKVEDLRMAVDENNSVFVAYMVWPAARCQFISKYGSSVKLESWPMDGRSKHPDVGVDENYVHITWQQMWSQKYTIGYCKRSNSLNGSWQPVIDVRDGAHRPRIAMDPNRVAHLFFMDDLEPKRITIYKYWTGSGFSPKYVISDGDTNLFNNIGLGVYDSDNIFFMELTTTQIFYNWKQNGNWSGHKLVEKTRARPDNTWTALSPDGKTAVIVYTDRGNSVYMNISSDEIAPPPPTIPNKPPTALFTFTPLSGLYPLRVTFNAKNSSDSDGQIVSYRWDFGDGAKGSGSLTEHVYQGKNRFHITLVVTDDDGATGTATGEIEVFGLYPPLNVQYARYQNRNLFSVEYLYRITWNPNPSNEEVGAKIASYKIYRREKGSSYDYGLFYTFPAGNQADYEYLDRTLGRTAKEYEYKISSVDSFGRESELN